MTDAAHQRKDLACLAFQVSTAPQVIIAHRVVVDCNAAFLALFGYEREDLVGHSTLKLYPSRADYHDIGERSLGLLRRSSNGASSDERFMQHRNGEIFWARAKGYTLTPQDPFHLMVWHFDRLDCGFRPEVNLTPREREISVHIANGLTCKEIARTLAISHRTVEAHRARVMSKLHARNSAELVSKIIVLI